MPPKVWLWSRIAFIDMLPMSNSGLERYRLDDTDDMVGWMKFKRMYDSLRVVNIKIVKFIDW